jgi:malonate transporter MadM subunit
MSVRACTVISDSMAVIRESLTKVMTANGLIVAFVFVGALVWLAYLLSNRFTRGRIHGSAIAIALGLVLAYIGGTVTGGKSGLADFSLLAGVGLMGGGMFRDFAIVATAFGADLGALRRAGLVGALSVVLGVVLSFITGAIVAVAFGYTDPVAISTIGAGAATYIVGPVTGDALGASSDVIALSIAAGLTKSVLVMVGTPLVARRIGLNSPHSALIYGGLMGTTSGVAGGLAATDPKLVPYGAMTATFYTGVGCLLAPSILYRIVAAIF